MFSGLLQKKIARFMAAVMLVCNISPVFAMRREVAPDFHVRVERQSILNPITNMMVAGILVDVARRAEQTIDGIATVVYQSILNQAIAPFMLPTAATQADVVQTGIAATLSEILQKTKAEIQQIGVPSLAKQETESSENKEGIGEKPQNPGDVQPEEAKTSEDHKLEVPAEEGGSKAADVEIEVEADAATSQKDESLAQVPSASIQDASSTSAVSSTTVETEVSHGFCLSIPELGDLLISHEGDVVFDSPKAQDKSIRIEAPSRVVLNNTAAKHIDVEATAAFLTGGNAASLDCLRFRGIGDESSDVVIPSNGLFIDKEASLQVKDLFLEDGLLLNSGKLSVTTALDLNGGYFFNSGEFATSADPSVLQNISYMFNGSSGSMTASGKMVIGASKFSNLGSVKAGSLSVVTSDLLDNQGSIETSGSLELSGLGKAINTGKIDGKSGSVLVSGAKFEHAKGEISAAKVDFGSSETVIAGSVIGQEGFFRNSVTNTGGINLQHGVISGTFVNSSNTTKFQQQLDLTGARAEIQNRGKIETATIVSDATTGIVDGGDVLAATAQSKKHLQLGCNMPSLAATATDSGSQLLLSSNATAPNLRRVQNAGTTTIAAATPNLTDLQNASTGVLQLQNSAPLSKISTLDHLRGKLDVGASMPAIATLNLQGGATLNLMGEADFSSLRDITVQSGSTFSVASGASLYGLKNIYNFGTMTTESQLSGLDAVYNGPQATLHFLEMAKIQGRYVSTTDRRVAPAISSLSGGKIGLFNEGKILTRVYSGSSGLEATDYRGVDIKSGDYVASSNAVFRMESGGVRSYDFINDGIFYSPTKLKYSTRGGRITRWGRGVAEDGIEYDIDSQFSGTLSDSFKPIINGPNKTLKITSKAGLNIWNTLNWNVDLEVEAPTFNGDADLTVRRFKAKTTTFNNTEKLSAKDGINIDTYNFANTSGRLQTHGNVTIKASGKFRNTGGGSLIKDVPETITNYVWDGTKLVSQNHTFYRDIYSPNLWKAGVITCGGFLDISVGNFDNGFGILNAAQGMQVRSRAALFNECGLIYSGGPTLLAGTYLHNGYRSGSKSVRGVDPNDPIKENRVVPYQVWVKSGYSKRDGGPSGWFGGNHWVDTSHNETRHRNETVTTGYVARTQYTSASKYPGYIFSRGDLDINMDSDLYLGTIVSGGDVRLNGSYQRSINSYDRGLLVVRGDVVAELRKAALHQVSIQAQNIYFQLIEDMMIRGIITPVVLPDGSAVQIINLRQLGQQLGFLIDGSTFATQGSIVPRHTGLMPISATTPDAISVYSTASSASSAALRSRTTSCRRCRTASSIN